MLCEGRFYGNMKNNKSLQNHIDEIMAEMEHATNKISSKGPRVPDEEALKVSLRIFLIFDIVYC